MANEIFRDTFFIAGIMCHENCAPTIELLLKSCIQECKDKALLPADAEFNYDTDPKAPGIHRLILKITGEVPISDSKKLEISTLIRSGIGFEVLENLEEEPEASDYTHWINIIINLVSFCTISILSIAFPPSSLLTIGLTSLSFLTTAFTARTYLINFFLTLSNIRFTFMPTTITLGWFLSVAHTLYHSIRMPLASSFSMVFMNFLMPIILITVINVMDEIKRLVEKKSKKMFLSDMKALFPKMSEEYSCYPQTEECNALLIELITELDRLRANGEDYSHLYERLSSLPLNQNAPVSQEKIALEKDMILNVKQGECFPVDCILINGDTVIDASHLTGEPRKNKQCLEFIPAGALNLGQAVKVYVKETAYNSSVNKLLFVANRATENPVLKPTSLFTYLYPILIFLGIAASILMPLALGITSIPLLLQNVIGIIFAVCPCTIAIAHQLPNLLSKYQRGNNGILLRDERLIEGTSEIHTIVFDKTGTLTTGDSEVESHIGMTNNAMGISAGLWERIALLEERHGGEHPLAKAIIKYYDQNKTHERIFNDLDDFCIDPKNRGLSGIVQGIQIHIGNAAFLADQQITLPQELPEQILGKLQQGLTPIYVAENGTFQGVIFIKHEIRADVLRALSQLKDLRKKIIMLTGDNIESARGFNQQNDAIFDETIEETNEAGETVQRTVQQIYADQTPEMKEDFLKELMKTNPTGVWFVGDGLNDAPCSKIVTEKGGVSCAITSDDKSASFTDISLNGSLDYLFQHTHLNQFLKKTIIQNQGLLIYSLVAYLAFIITFSCIGIAVSPLIPLVIMLSTTLFTLFNSYRVQLSIDNALDNNPSWLKQLLASDASYALPLTASCLLICGIFISTVTTGALTFPSITFTAGALAAISSICILGASVIVTFFVLLAATHFITDKSETAEVVPKVEQRPTPTLTTRPSLPTIASNHSEIAFDATIESNSELQVRMNPGS